MYPYHKDRPNISQRKMFITKVKKSIREWTSFERHKAGFTLIEVIVASTIFIIVMTIASGTLLGIITANSKAQSISSVMTNLSFALDNMINELRDGENYQCTGDPCDSVSFDSSAGVVVTYDYDATNQSITEKVGSADAVPLTAEDVHVEQLDFYVRGVGDDGLQPRVLMVVRGYAGNKPSVRSSFSMQTTATQRKLDQFP
jgi:type II secretory pathway pseudopilin PulG